MPNVLVTGASGHIGAHVVRALLDDGNTVAALVRHGSTTRGLAGLAVEIRRGDLLDAASVNAAVRESEAVFHVGTQYRNWTADPNELIRPAVEGTRNVLEAAKAGGVRRVVVTGSVACVGYTPDPSRPYDETHYNSRTSSAYIRAKCEQERVAVEMAKSLDLDVMMALPTAVFGPLDYRMTPASRGIRDVFNGGPVTFGLNVVHPRDVADGMLLMWKKGRRGERYLLGGDNVPQREMAELVARLTGGKPKAMTPPKLLLKLIGHVSVLSARIRHADAELDPAMVEDVAGCHLLFDTSKARRELGYAPRGPEAVLTESLRWLLYRGQINAKTAHRIRDRYPPDPEWRDAPATQHSASR